MREQRHRVLLVDDEADLLSLWKLRLESNGYDVTTALSGEEALAKMSVINPNVVLTDLRMPGINGMDLFSGNSRAQQDNSGHTHYRTWIYTRGC